MSLRLEQLRTLVQERTIEVRTPVHQRGHALALSVHLNKPLEENLLDRIVQETTLGSVTPIEGAIYPRSIEAAPERLTFLLNPLSPYTVRLDTLLDALQVQGAPLGGPLACAVLAQVSAALDALHESPGQEGEVRVHGAVHAGTIILENGATKLMGCGLPMVDALMVPALSKEADRYRYLAPEAARGEPLDPRADVYSLGVLYYQLLSGQRYREGASASAICQMALEGKTPDLPGALPDPRPTLVQVLATALNPDRAGRYPSASTFAQSAVHELQSAGWGAADQGLLQKFVSEYVPQTIKTGPVMLLEAEHNPADFVPNTVGEIEEPEPIAQVHIPTSEPTRPAPDAWSEVLGASFEEDTWTGGPKTPAQEPAVASAPRRASQLPVPGAEPLMEAKTPATSKPLPAQKPAPAAPPALDFGLESPKGPNSPRAKRTPKPRPSSKASAEKSNLKLTLAIAAALVLVGAFGYSLWMNRIQREDPTPRAPVGVEPPPTYSVRPQDAGVEPPPPPQEEQPKPLGLLTVLSQPSGATVELDGGYVGKTPLVMRHRFTKEEYTVRVLSEGHKTWEKKVSPDPKAGSISVMAVLKKE